MSYGSPDLGQLAQGLADSAQAVVAAVQSGIAYVPNGPAIAQAVGELARKTQFFRDSVFANQPPSAIGNAYTDLDTLAGQLHDYFTTNQTTPQIQSAWERFADLEVQTAHASPNNSFPAAVPQSSYTPMSGGVSPIAGLADQLQGETTAFIANFIRTAGRVPEGRFMLAEAQQLEVAATDFRQNVYAGLPPDQLSQQFINVTACWQRLGQRVDRIARGQIGPNIAQVQKLGVICSQIGQTLGIPGY